MFIRNKIFYCVIGENEIFREIGGPETAHVTCANDLRVLFSFFLFPFFLFSFSILFFSSSFHLNDDINI